MRDQRRRGRSAFTLVEVLIVVVILGILAATVLPQFADSTGDARSSAVRQDLRTLRAQIELFRHQHNGQWPAAGSKLAVDFENAMLLSSDPDGTTGAVGTKPLGPYFVGSLPPNPYNNLRTVTVVDVAALPVADGTTGWIYSSNSGLIKANTKGETTPDGTSVEAL